MWEYKSIGADGGVTSEMLNRMGKDGWELVAIYPVIYTTGREKAVFKRKIDE
jgi:hypothetical protein